MLSPVEMVIARASTEGSGRRFKSDDSEFRLGAASGLFQVFVAYILDKSRETGQNKEPMILMYYYQ